MWWPQKKKSPGSSTAGITTEIGEKEMSKKEFLSPEFTEAQRQADAELDRQFMSETDADIDGFDKDPVKKVNTYGGYKHPGPYDPDGPWDIDGLWRGYGAGGWEAYNKKKGGTGLSAWKTCNHKPQLVIDHEGFRASFGKKWDCELQADNYGVILNLTGHSIDKEPELLEHVIPIKSLAKWKNFSNDGTTASKTTAKEIVLDWPDMGVLYFPLDFWEGLVKATKAEGGKLLAFCVGGHGRTGTAMACLLITVLGFSADEAMKWIRKNYCTKAIETEKQENYVIEIWRQYRQKYDIPERDKPKQKQTQMDLKK
jgi:protein-tyrosine phosphatase